MNDLIYIVLDSCRYDTFAAARTPNADRLGPAEMRYAYASWTSPSHYAMLMGLTPHSSPTGLVASEVYKRDFLLWRERLGAPDLDFASFVPELSLPRKLSELGYRTAARVSLPVLNPSTSMSTGFHDYKLMDDHNDFAGMIREMTFDNHRPTFYFLNLGETHYPYMLPAGDAPILHGVSGVYKQLGDKTPSAEYGPAEPIFDAEKMDGFRQAQIRACEYVDGLLGRLFAKAPAGAHFIVTADHGELFGEDGYFGHGPIFHPKVFEVPFIEGKLDADGIGAA
jgi:arylsulfatase A-like enzyme